MQILEIWKFLAGLGLFLYGMSLLESTLKKISGRSLKIFLNRNTNNLFKAIASGAIVTGIVQSSSVVSLIVLAFTEAEILSFRNALGLILGANLGTTFDSWLVAYFGFKVNMLNYTYPVIAVTAIMMFFNAKRKPIFNISSVFFSIGILFLGLEFLKDAAEQLVMQFDIKSFNNYGSPVFVLVGFALTLILQSSSATMAITLTAIYSGVLNFPAAAAIIIGSEVGTTIKILLWGLSGSNDKKRVAIGNFMYNIFTAIIAYLFLHWLIFFIENTVSIQDPLIGLVFFQTLINILSIILFVPFLNIFSKWLQTRFKNSHNEHSSYIGQNLPLVPILATETLRTEAMNLLEKTLLFNKNILATPSFLNPGLLKSIRSSMRNHTDIEVEYERLKQTEGDLLTYYSDVQENNKDKVDTSLQKNYINAVRQCVHAAKTIKDIDHNLKEFDSSTNDILYQQCENISKEWISFDKQLRQFIKTNDKDRLYKALSIALNESKTKEEKQKSEILNQLRNDELKELESSTLMNVNRNILSAKKAFIKALSYIMLPNDEYH